MCRIERCGGRGLLLCFHLVRLPGSPSAPNCQHVLAFACSGSSCGSCSTQTPGVAGDGGMKPEKCVAGAEVEGLERLHVGTLVPGRVGWSVLH